MSVDLDVLSLRADLITPREFIDAWAAYDPATRPSIHRLRSSALAVPVDEPLALITYGLMFSDGVGMSFGAADNGEMMLDEQASLEDFGDVRHLAGVIAGWRAAGHTYSFTVSGAYGRKHVRRMEQSAAVVARLVGGRVLVFERFFSQPRGVYPPEVFL